MTKTDLLMEDAEDDAEMNTDHFQVPDQLTGHVLNPVFEVGIMSNVS